MVWPSKTQIDLITKHLDELVSPRLIENGFQKKFGFVEECFEWRFVKIEGSNVKQIIIRTVFHNSIIAEFWVNRMPPKNFRRIDKLIANSPFDAGIKGYCFNDENELRQLLSLFVTVIEDKGMEMLDNMLKNGKKVAEMINVL